MQLKKGQIIRMKGGYAKPRGKQGLYTVYWLDASMKSGYASESTDSSDPNFVYPILVDKVRAIGKGEKPVVNGRVTMYELLQDLIAHYQRKDFDTTAWVEARIRNYLAPKLGHLKANDVTKDTIINYIDERLKMVCEQTGRKPAKATINNELRNLRTAFNIARERGKIASVPSFKGLIFKDVVRENCPEPEDMQKVLETPIVQEQMWLSVYYQTLWALVWRKNSVLKLEWSDINFDTGRIHGRGLFQKNGDPLKPPMSPKLYTLLKAWRDHNKKYYPDCPYVFHREGVQVKCFRAAHATAMEQAGLKGTWVHDFRRASYANLREAGVDGKVIREMAGQKTAQMEERYKIVKNKDQVIAGQKLDAYLEGRLTGTDDTIARLKADKNTDKSQTNRKKIKGLTVVK